MKDFDMKYHFWLCVRDICREGDADPDPGPDPDPDPGPGGGEKTFTQDEVNTLLAKERRNGQTKVQEQIRTLEAIKRDGLTPEDKATLEQQIESLRGQSQTEIELAKQSLTKERKKWEADRAKLTEERDAVASKYNQLQIDTVLSTAMGLHGVTPDATPIIRSYVAERLKQVPVMDDNNKPTGETRHVVTLEVKDDENPEQTKTLQLSPEKAIAHLKEQETFAALFASKARSGIGGHNELLLDSTDITKMTQAEYMEYRRTR